MSHIISASRRTDIPAFYSDWFVNRLREGHTYVQQPYSRKISFVSLLPGDINAIVFWSKNYRPFLSNLESIERATKNLFFHFTITANRELEFNVPDWQSAIKDYLFIAKRYSPKQIIWRYDPICITDKLAFEIHEERFIRCAEMLKGYAEKCYISFVSPYKKAIRNMQKYTDHRMIDLTIEQKREYGERLASRAEPYGVRLHACCNDFLVSENIQKGNCVDGRAFAEIFNSPFDARPAVIRKECACTKSIDIGAYNTCAHGCVYCYANTDKEKAGSACRRQDPEWNALGMNVTRNNDETFDPQQPSFIY